MKLEISRNLKILGERLPFSIYAVGGYVRNKLMKLPLSSDIDLAGGVSVNEIAKILDIKVTPINKTLGTALIIFNGESYEYTQFRCEEYENGGHSPSSVTFTNYLEEDAKRRDFTVNSIYYDIKNELIVDPFGGVNDLKSGVLRSADAEKIFSSDGLRLMRLVRFSAELGLKVEEKTAQAAIKHKENLKEIAAERKRDELDKILNSDQKYGKKNAHYLGIKLLYDLGLFEYILPSITKLDISQNPKYHKYNVLEHTFLAVKFAEPDIRLAALMHDIGKPLSVEKFGNMYYHAMQGEIIAREQLGQNGLKYKNIIVKEVCDLIRLHMYDLHRNTSDGKMRLFIAENFTLIDKLYRLQIADGLATGNKNQHPPRLLEIKEKMLKEGSPISVSDLEIDGQDAVNAGLKGVEINTFLQAVLRECILNPRLNARKWLLNRLNVFIEQTLDN